MIQFEKQIKILKHKTLFYRNQNENQEKYSSIHIDIVTLSLLANIYPIMLFYEQEYIFLTILTLFSSLFSFCYHITKESIPFFLYLDMISSIVCGFYFLSIILFHENVLSYLFLLSISITFYILGMGRNKEQHRTIKYTIYHTCWHLSMCFTGIYFGCTCKI